MKAPFGIGLPLALLIAFQAGAAEDGDWPQLAHDPGRTACASKGVAPPYRARWIWCGRDKTLRNRAADPAWPNDL